ncbi:VOC family protein [Sphaerisporangium sp. NBC_01403]|uniref:VOC family protein n=1 Tax=Sphaerisporangium sp. NBC_01403 TaxID=2903599 RepID=UPI003254D6C3
MTLRSISVVSIPVSDQDRAAEFYTRRLGFTLVADNPMGDRRWVQLTPPGGGATITLVTWFPSMAPGSVSGLVIECDEVAATLARLRAEGVTVHQDDVEKAPWGAFFTFEDPDGNGWVAQESTPARA